MREEWSDVSCRASSLIARSRSSWLRGDIAGSLAEIEEARRVACPAGSCCRMPLASREATTLIMLGDLAGARRVLDREAPLGPDRTEPTWDRPLTLMLHAYLALASGDVERTAALAEDSLRTADACGLRLWHHLGHSLLAVVNVRRVDIGAAMACVTQLGECAMLGRAQHTAGQCAWITAVVYRAKNDVDGALRLSAELTGPGQVSRELLLSQPGAAPWLARFTLGVGQAGLARRTLRTATELADRNPRFPTVTTAAVHTRGLVENSLDDLVHASRAHRDVWARASALEDIGTFLSADPARLDDASHAYDRAATAYLTAGSTYDYLRAKSKIRGLGKAALPSLEAAERRLAFTQLTRGEYDVARLVAQGMTNVQVARVLSLSPHTVAFHLRKVFRKLTVSSRVELAHMWGARTSAESG
ncbi:LuxR C-terminal-related transcriptional regulator [Streptomyces sp. NPDC004539]|uniref:helix-turn-helix transcriptional regulator n=1 Tax=Streptomyces sp. NPDC004539 TaxID=3154280 RepID=UPI0033B44E67